MKKTEPLRDEKMLKRLAEYWQTRGNFRNHVLIILGASTALKVSDLLNLTWQDVYDEEQGTFRSHILLKDQKGVESERIALSKMAIQALLQYYPHRRGNFIFASTHKDARPIRREQAWRIINEATENLNITGTLGCQGLRKSFGFFS